MGDQLDEVKVCSLFFIFVADLQKGLGTRLTKAFHFSQVAWSNHLLPPHLHCGSHPD